MLHSNPDLERKTGLFLLRANIGALLLVGALSAGEKLLTGQAHTEVYFGAIEGAPAMGLLIWCLCRIIPQV